jgi:hypothetical protein
VFLRHFEVELRIGSDMARLAVNDALSVLTMAQRAAQLAGVAVVRIGIHVLGLFRDGIIRMTFGASLGLGRSRRIGNAVALVAGNGTLLMLELHGGRSGVCRLSSGKRKRAAEDERFEVHGNLLN